MTTLEVTLFIVAAMLAGGLTMGGVTLVYFLDKWRGDAPTPSTVSRREHAESSPFREAG
jgi:hypothetical protein